MTVRYQLTAEDYIALNRYLLQHDPAMRARIRALQLGGAAAVLALGAAVCRFALHGAYFPMMGLFALAAVLFALYADNQARSSLSKQVELQVREGAGFALGGAHAHARARRPDAVHPARHRAISRAGAVLRHARQDPFLRAHARPARAFGAVFRLPECG